MSRAAYQIPTPEQIRNARELAKLTQAQAAERVFAGSYRTWQDWESGRRPMPANVWELWRLQSMQKAPAVD